MSKTDGTVLVDKRELDRIGEAIEAWLSVGQYPEEYLLFFFYWSLFNSYYGLSVPKGGDRGKVLSFARQHEALWDDTMEGRARDLVALECVGHGRGMCPPSSYVKAATNQLRETLGMPQEERCSYCRHQKKEACSRIEERGKFGRLEAVLRIIYELRCNLVHGDKTELTGDQGQRNVRLVRLANPIIKELLRNL